ncbi:hypothetical protein D9758_010865 [Tetrapyrgos nigripes]|uniref:Uncharacterized protein n=1 Tax=Tetrapyrgos nigripes TaxID=182062 RepID=A0A8H5LQC1_9AGAR|nr:hypothetical protein D9758_010865 [Tetrapyrgos nigripes]
MDLKPPTFPSLCVTMTSEADQSEINPSSSGNNPHPHIEREKVDPKLMLKPGTTCTQMQSAKKRESAAADQCAVDVSGNLKDAKDIDWSGVAAGSQEKRKLADGEKPVTKRPKMTATNGEDEELDEDDDVERDDTIENSDSDVEMTEGEKCYWEAKAGTKGKPTKCRTQKAKEMVDLHLCYQADAILVDSKMTPGSICRFCFESTHSTKQSFYTGNVTSRRCDLEHHHNDNYFKLCEENNVEQKAKQLSSAVDVDGPIQLFSCEGLLEYIIELIADADEKDIPHCTTLTTAIKEKHQTLIQWNKEILKNIDLLISMTFDGWSKKHRKAFESLTVHFIQPTDNNPSEWSLHAHLLTFDCQKGHHTGEENGNHLANTIQEYGYVDTVGWFTSDRVSVNDKSNRIACKILDPSGKVLKPKERHTNCIDHMFHLMPSHFCQALQIPSIMAIGCCLHANEMEELFEGFDDNIDTSQEEEPNDDDDEAVEQALSTEWINFKQVVMLCRDVLMVTVTRNAILGKEDVATSQWVIPAMHEVKVEWEKFLDNDAYKIIAPTIQAGLNSMYKWYCKITEDTPVYFICHADSYMDKLIEEKRKQSVAASHTKNTSSISQYDKLDKYLAVTPGESSSSHTHGLQLPSDSSIIFQVQIVGLTDVARRGRKADDMFEALQCLKGAYKDGHLSARNETWMAEKLVY